MFSVELNPSVQVDPPAFCNILEVVISFYNITGDIPTECPPIDDTIPLTLFLEIEE